MLLCREQADDEADTLWDAAIAGAAVSSQSSASPVEDTARDALCCSFLAENYSKGYGFVVVPLCMCSFV